MICNQSRNAPLRFMLARAGFIKATLEFRFERGALRFVQAVCLHLYVLCLSTHVEASEAYGIGVALAKHPDGFLVAKVLTNSPAAIDGSIREGDLVTAVSQTNAA